MSEPAGGEERRLTPAQVAHLRRLYQAFERAEDELNSFAAYLLAELGIADPEYWQLAPDLTRFVRAGTPSEPTGSGSDVPGRS